MAKREMIRIMDLAGVSVRWGTWDKIGSRKIRKDFKDVLEAALFKLWDMCPWGPPQRILSGGAYVDKGGRHGRGTAFDLSGLMWPDRPVFSCIKTASHDDWGRYLAIEAGLRKGVPQVLNWWAPDRKHKDHWHLDDRPVQGFQANSFSDVAFLQASLTHLWGYELVIDGDFGPKTQHAAGAAMQELDFDGASDLQHIWNEFLDATIRAGFVQAELELVGSHLAATGAFKE